MDLTRLSNPLLPDDCCFETQDELTGDWCPETIEIIEGCCSGQSLGKIWRIVIPKTAVDTLAAHRVVKNVGESGVDYADNLVPADEPIVLGVTAGAATTGNKVNVIVQGEVDDTAWTWTPDQLIYLSTDGQMTQTIPVAGFVKIIGVALSATRMRVTLQSSPGAGIFDSADLNALLVINEIPAGAIDGSNATFTTAFDFIPGSVDVKLNGVTQQIIADFNTAGTQTVFLVTSPTAGEHILVSYIKQ